MSTDRIERRKKLYDSMVDKYNKDYGTSLEKFNYILKGENKWFYGKLCSSKLKKRCLDIWENWRMSVVVKVTIFRNDNAYKLQDQVNDFIKDKNVKDIKYSSYPIPTEFRNNCTPMYTMIYDSVLVIYEEE